MLPFRFGNALRGDQLSFPFWKTAPCANHILLLSFIYCRLNSVTVTVLALIYLLWLWSDTGNIYYICFTNAPICKNLPRLEHKHV